LWLRDYGPTEVGGFGLTAAEDLLLVEDIELVRQRCSSVTVAFDDEAVADYFDCQVDLGLSLEQFGRIWIHTHPGSCPEPSSIDEETFARVFGRSQWAVMFILARGGASYARLRFSVGPGGDQLLPVRVDFQRPFLGSNQAAWEAEYHRNVEALPTSQPWFDDPWDSFGDLVTERDRKRGQSPVASQPVPPF
jgi:proteasome lid subunit RPN8/RPN11